MGSKTNKQVLEELNLKEISIEETIEELRNNPDVKDDKNYWMDLALLFEELSLIRLKQQIVNERILEIVKRNTL